MATQKDTIKNNPDYIFARELIISKLGLNNKASLTFTPIYEAYWSPTEVPLQYYYGIAQNAGGTPVPKLGSAGFPTSFGFPILISHLASGSFGSFMGYRITIN